jgi:hypothetical protein
MTKPNSLAMDGFNRIKPLQEGYVVKGGVNTASEITVRPPPPAPMRPAVSTSGSTKGKAS